MIKLLPGLLKLEAALTHANTSLKDIGSDPIAVTDSVELSGNAIGASATAQANVSVMVLNDVKDDDPERVIGIAKEQELADAGIAWLPQIKPSDDLVYLMYKASAKLKLGLSSKIGLAAGSIQLGISADRELVLSAYMPHANKQQTLLNAVRQDLNNGVWRSLLDYQQCKDLPDQHALSLRIPGRMSAFLKLSLSETLASSLGSLSRALGLNQVLGLSIQAGAKLEASVSVNDDFQLALVRKATNYHIALRKAQQSSTSVALGLGIDIGLSSASQQLLLGLTNQILDQATAGLSKLIAHLEGLDPTQTIRAALTGEYKIYGDLLANYGLSLPDPVGELKERLLNQRSKVVSELTELVKTQLKISFTFNYQKIATDGSIIELELPAAGFTKAIHQSMLSFDFMNLLSDIAQGKLKATVHRYLHQKSIERTSTIGISLGLGSWLSIKSATTRKQRFVTQINKADERKLSLLGSYQYSGKWHFLIDDNVKWDAHFDASMRAFVSNPRRSDFSTKLSLSYSHDINEHQFDLADALDTALCFGVFDDAGLLATQAQLQSMLFVPTKASVMLSLEGDFLQRVLAAPGYADLRFQGEALAAAMGRFSAMKSYRADLASRIKNYRTFWALALKNKPSWSLARSIIHSTLHDAGVKANMLKLEAGNGTSMKQANPASAIRLCQDNGDLTQSLHNFAEACNSVATGKDLESLEHAIALLFDAHDGAFDNAFLLRATAYMLSRVALSDALTASSKWQASLWLANAEKEMVFGQQ